MQGYTTLNAKDVNSSKLGKVFCTVNGNRYLAMFVKDIEVTVEKTKTDVPILGQLQPGNKTTGLKYSGSATIYDVTPIFKQMFLKLQNEGVDTYFDMQIDSEDPTSDSGNESIVLEGVNLDKTILSKLDADGDWKESDSDFTFERFRIPKAYKELDGVKQ